MELLSVFLTMGRLNLQTPLSMLGIYPLRFVDQDFTRCNGS